MVSYRWILLSLCCFFLSSISFAEPKPIGQIVWVKGEVKAMEANQAPRILQRRSPIFENDLIITDKKSTGEIVFSDKSIVALRENTEFRIDAYRFGKDVPAKDSKYVATIIKGGFRTITGFIPKNNPDNYQVKTPVATIAVQGTEYSIFYQNQLWVQYTSGKPCIANAQGSMCLDEKNRYANVASATSAPIRAAASAAAMFQNEPKITPASFNPNATPDNTTVAPTATGTIGGGNSGTGSGTSSGSSGTSGTGVTGGSEIKSGVVSGFCIGG